MTAVLEHERAISAALLRLRARSPFFAVLALFASWRPDPDAAPLCTDGEAIFYAPDRIASLAPRELDALVLHQLLHAALAHPLRRGERDPARWAAAADVVVHGIVADQPFVAPPPDALRAPALERFSVEEVYALLPLDHPAAHPQPRCLRSGPSRDDGLDDGKGAESPRAARLAAHWRQAITHAAAVARTHAAGALPAGLERLVDEITHPALDWRVMLWRFLTRTPVDFAGFDRRQLWRGLYVDDLVGQSLRAAVCVDTSASIGDGDLASFLDEVRGIVASYPHLTTALYFADTKLHGPFALDHLAAMPRPQGGGGTSFEPFFSHVDAASPPFDVCVYLTDGYGLFPPAPHDATLWVVTAGGQRDGAFPFGQVTRLLAST